jgi:hypothetical protein
MTIIVLEKTCRQVAAKAGTAAPIKANRLCLALLRQRIVLMRRSEITAQFAESGLKPALEVVFAVHCENGGPRWYLSGR